ncbi:MAG: AAA family ATPase [Roseibium sp.]
MTPCLTDKQDKGVPKQKSVVLLDGPVGVGKTSLGRAAATQLSYAFIDGDDHSMPGNWLGTILQTSRRIVAASAEALQSQPVVIVSYPLRCTNWIFYHQTFERMGIQCRCIGLFADISAISNRARTLSEHEIARSSEMIAQGYGQRSFSDFTVRTDNYDFDETCLRLTHKIQQALTGK